MSKLSCELAHDGGLRGHWNKICRIDSQGEVAFFHVNGTNKVDGNETKHYIMKEMELSKTAEARWPLLESWKSEVKAVKWLSHPGVVGIPEFVESAEIESGQKKVLRLILSIDAWSDSKISTLASLVEDGWRPTEETVVRIACQLLQALSHLRSYHPTPAHGAISPNNILLAHSPRCQRVSSWMIRWGASDGFAVADAGQDMLDLGAALAHILSQGDTYARSDSEGRLGGLVQGLLSQRWPTPDAALGFLASPAAPSQPPWPQLPLPWQLPFRAAGGSLRTRPELKASKWRGRWGADTDAVLRSRPAGGRLRVSRVSVGRGAVELTVDPWGVSEADRSIAETSANETVTVVAIVSIAFCLLILVSYIMALISIAAGVFTVCISGFLLASGLLIQNVINIPEIWEAEHRRALGAFAWKEATLQLAVDARAVRVAFSRPAPSHPPAVTLLRDDAVMVWPVWAAGGAGALGGADVALVQAEGGEVRLGLAVSREEAEFVAALLCAKWPELVAVDSAE